MKFLDLLGLTEFFNNLKIYFAPLIHKHTKADIEDLVEVQSDWNQNDETADDYIKNRPFYKVKDGYTTESRTTVVEETTIPIEDTSAFPTEYYIELAIEKDKTYIVTWNGVEYTCVGKFHEEYNLYYLGNAKIAQVDENSDTGEPFGIVYYEGNTSTFADTVGNHTIKIDVKDTIVVPEEVVKLDSKYLPSYNWNQNDPNGAGYIENRTHWKEENTVDILPLATIKEYEVGGEYNRLQYFDLVLGNEYVVEFNGNKYTCIAKIYDQWYPSLGNMSIRDESAENTGEPFFLYTYSTHSYVGFFAKESGAITIKITEDRVDYHTIDRQYLPHLVGHTQNENFGEIFNDYERNTATGEYSHAEGNNTTASGESSHAEGHGTTASGWQSHAEGGLSIASGIRSHAEGNWTIAASDYQHAQGKYNVEDTENKYAHIVGNGHYDHSRSNAHTLDWEGNAWFAGDVLVGGTSQDDGKKLATEEYVLSEVGSANQYTDEAIANLVGTAPETLDTIQELATAMQENDDVVTALNDAITTKADKTDIVQGDWNQNDETKLDYIKNRTHYINTNTIIPLITVTTEVTGSGSATTSKATLQLDNTLDTDSEYIITLNGSSHNAKLLYGFTWMGDSYYFSVDETNDDYLQFPFVEGSSNGTGMIAINYDEDKNAIIIYAPVDSNVYDITLEIIKEDIVKLDEIFIPDSIARNSEVASTYIKNLSTSGSTLTFTKGDDTTSTIEIEDDDLITTEASGEVTGEEPTLNPVAEARISAVETSLAAVSSDIEEVKTEVIETIQSDIAEIEEKIVQSDWNQVDDTAIDYIKNKPIIPSDEDIIVMFADMNAINIVYADAEGTTAYIDNDGKVLIY